MTVLLFFVATLPPIALVGPVLIGWYFDSDWVLKVGFGFDIASVLLGATCLAVFGPWSMEPSPKSAAAVDLLMFVGGSLIVSGLVFGGATAWLLFGRGTTRRSG
jgi:hypothetical protein